MGWIFDSDVFRAAEEEFGEVWRGSRDGRKLGLDRITVDHGA